MIARAWNSAAVGETTAAKWHAGNAADRARRAGMYAVEMSALHTAVRFGAHAQVARMRWLAQRLDRPLATAMADHCRGLADHDGERLDAVAQAFIDMGAMAMAADAAAHAASEHGRSGHRAREVESATRAQWLAGQCGLRSPAIMAIEEPLPITDREREVAVLVGSGLTNREIADNLGVSVRTIDGHLYRIYAKLGVASREQLARLIRRAT